jgi:hypothetical protein
MIVGSVRSVIVFAAGATMDFAVSARISTVSSAGRSPRLGVGQFGHGEKEIIDLADRLEE